MLVASVSLGAAGLLHVKVDRLERVLSTARAGPWEGKGRPSADDPAASSWSGVPRVEGGEFAPAAGDGGEGLEPGVGGAGREPTVEERLARLEERQRTLDGGPGLTWRPGRRTPVRSLDELAQRLTLTATQRSRIEDAIARGRQRVEDVLKIPDETGKSPFERRAEARKRIEEAMRNPGAGGLLAFASDLVGYRDKRIPGRADTYGDEIDRIRKETREEVDSALDAKQQETFRDTSVDGLLGDAAQVSFAYAVGDAGAAGEAGVVIEMESGEGESAAEPAAPAERR
jgi:hypothetical protein